MLLTCRNNQAGNNNGPHHNNQLFDGQMDQFRMQDQFRPPTNDIGHSREDEQLQGSESTISDVKKFHPEDYKNIKSIEALLVTDDGLKQFLLNRFMHLQLTELQKLEQQMREQSMVNLGLESQQHSLQAPFLNSHLPDQMNLIPQWSLQQPILPRRRLFRSKSRLFRNFGHVRHF